MKRKLKELVSFTFFLVGIVTVVGGGVASSVYFFNHYSFKVVEKGEEEVATTTHSHQKPKPTEQVPQVVTMDPCFAADGVVNIREEKQENGTYPFVGSDVEQESWCAIYHALKKNQETEPRKRHAVYFFNQMDPQLTSLPEGFVVMRTSPIGHPPASMVTRALCLQKLVSAEWRQYTGFCYALTAHIGGFGHLLSGQQEERWIRNSFQPKFAMAELYHIAEMGGRNLFEVKGGGA